MFFKCKHPVGNLFVLKPEEVTEDKNSNFDDVTYFFVCGKCGEQVTIKYAKLKVSVEKWLSANTVTQATQPTLTQAPTPTTQTR